MASALIANSSTSRLGPGEQVRDQLINGLAGQLRVSGDGDVEVIHVGLVVLVMVQVHGGRVKVRLQSIVGVGQGRQSERPSGRRWQGCGCGLAVGEPLGTQGFG